MQNFHNQPGQSMAPAIEYLSQVQRIYLDSWRRCGDAGVRWTQSAMDEMNHIGQDMMSLVSEAQVALARTLSDSTRATADVARSTAEQLASQLERAGREQADTMREQGGAMAEQVKQAAEHAQQAATPQQPGAEKREGAADKRDGGRGKGGQDSASTMH